MSRQSTNTFIIQGDVMKIITKKGETILADAEDFDRLKKHSWCVSQTGYAVCCINNKIVRLHRYLFGLTDPKLCVDHKNHKQLDNRKCNLRVCTALENARNASGKKSSKYPVGIRFTPSGKYLARIQVNNKEIRIGLFKKLEDAIKARHKAEIEYFGDFAQHLYRDL